MTILGINLAKGQIRYSLLDGTRAQPNLVNKGKLDVDETMATPELMNWYRANFDTIINRHKPDGVAYRMFWAIKKQDQAKNLLLPFGVLNLYCYQNNLPVEGFGGQAITPKKLGLPKGEKPITVCDKYIGAHPPHWNDAQRYSALAAWAALPE